MCVCARVRVHVRARVCVCAVLTFFRRAILGDLLDYSLPASSVHWISQARIAELVSPLSQWGFPLLEMELPRISDLDSSILPSATGRHRLYSSHLM